MPRKAYKLHPKFSFSPLRWPEGQDTCPPEQREKGTFKLATPAPRFVDWDGFISIENGSLVRQALRSFSNFCKRAEILNVEISMNFETDEDALDEKFSNPGVVIYYRWGLKDHYIAMDCFTRGACNLKAACEVIQGYYTVTRYPRAVSDFEHLSSFREHRMVEQKPPAKTSLLPMVHWQQILEIDNSEVDFRTGIPFDRHLAGRKRLQLAMLYHPDKGKVNDDGASMQVIEDAFKFVTQCFELHDEMAKTGELDLKMQKRQEAAERLARKKQKELDEINAILAEDAEPSDEDLKALEASEEYSDDSFYDFDQSSEYAEEVA